MYLAGYIVTGFLVAGAYAFGAPARALGPLRAHRARDPADGRRARVRRCRCSSATGRRARSRAHQPTKLAAFEGLGRDQTRARPCTCSAGTATAEVEYGIPHPAAALAARLPRPERARRRASTPCRADERPPVNVVRIAFQTMVGIGTLLALLGVVVLSSCAGGASGCRSRPWFYRALVARRAALGRGADLRLGDDRGRAPALGRLPA